MAYYSFLTARVSLVQVVFVLPSDNVPFKTLKAFASAVATKSSSGPLFVNGVAKDRVVKTSSSNFDNQKLVTLIFAIFNFPRSAWDKKHTRARTKQPYMHISSPTHILRDGISYQRRHAGQAICFRIYIAGHIASLEVEFRLAIP